MIDAHPRFKTAARLILCAILATVLASDLASAASQRDRARAARFDDSERPSRERREDWFEDWREERREDWRKPDENERDGAAFDARRERARRSSAPLLRDADPTSDAALIAEYDQFLESCGSVASGRIKRTERFVFLYNTSDAYVDWLAALMEEVAKAHARFAAKLGVKEIDFSVPMVVFVFAKREEYDEAERLTSGGDLSRRKNASSGFYSPTLDCTFVYDQTQIEAQRVEKYGAARNYQTNSKTFAKKMNRLEIEEIKMRDDAVYNTETIAHEATHQLSYKSGLVTRNGAVPQWAVEGMAMLAEPTDASAPLGWKARGAVFRVNRNRLSGFLRYADKEPKLSMVEKLILSDQPIRDLDSDAYCVSWAIFYYCYSKRAKDLAAFLEAQRARAPGRVDAETRKREFEERFGDIAKFKVALAKYAQSL